MNPREFWIHQDSNGAFYVSESIHGIIEYSGKPPKQPITTFHVREVLPEQTPPLCKHPEKDGYKPEDIVFYNGVAGRWVGTGCPDGKVGCLVYHSKFVPNEINPGIPEEKKDTGNAGRICPICGDGYVDWGIHDCKKRKEPKPSELQEMLDKISVGAMTNTDSLFYDDLKPLLQKIIDRIEKK